MTSERNLSPLFTWRSAVVESDLPPIARHVALTLSLHMNERGGSCFPSIQTLASETGLSKPSVISGIRQLEAGGFLHVDRAVGRGRVNRYSTAMPEKVNDVVPIARAVDNEVDQLERAEVDNQADHSSEKRSTSAREKVNVSATNGQPGKPEDVIRTSLGRVGASTSDEAPLPDPDWGEFEDVRKLCIQLGAEDMLDLAFWQRVDALTDGTQIYYDAQLRKYLAWWESKAPARRHRDRKRGFMNWIKEDISRENWRNRHAAR